MSNDSGYPFNWGDISAITKLEHGYTCYICELCQTEYPALILNVHHKDYDPHNNEPDNLVVLCRDCHIRLHALEAQNRFQQKAIKKLLSSGQLQLDIPIAFRLTPQEPKIEFLRQVALSHKNL